MRLPLEAVLCGDEEFDFGRERSDMIAIRTHWKSAASGGRAEALKRGGLLVVEIQAKVSARE